MTNIAKRIGQFSVFLLLTFSLVARFHPDSSLVVDAAVKCLDCVGEDCMGSFCYGDLCVLSYYAPRWGDVEWGKPVVVKGCLSGKMVRRDVRSHCEAADSQGKDIFTCFCDSNHCNGKAVRRLEVEQVELLECVCSGPHCKGQKSCLGELCSHVTNHRTKEVEQGCVNASVPLVERRTAGACMIPPITGAMHHTVARTADDLLKTESCVCGTSFCNEEKPRIRVQEKESCKAFVKAEVMGTKMSADSRRGCTGEYCFKAGIKSKLGSMTEYNTAGCASFIDDAVLAEELNPIGCANFTSENLEVVACLQTKDARAIGRARANQQVRDSPSSRGSSKNNGRQSKMEPETFDNDEEEAEDERRDEEAGAEETNVQNAKESREGDDEDLESDGENEEEGGPEATTELHYIFERPTLPPEPEDSSNTTLIAVFLLLILLIVLSSLVWKFELHKKLFRANYDTVAGG